MIGTFADRGAYGDYVQALYRFRAPLEQALGPACTHLVPALKADLSDLGLPCPETSPCPVPTGSALIGTLYVLEGSALGGQILRKRAAALGFDADFGARHLAGGIAGWLSFLSLLDKATPYAPDIAAEAGRAAFVRAKHAFMKAPE